MDFMAVTDQRYTNSEYQEHVQYKLAYSLLQSANQHWSLTASAPGRHMLRLQSTLGNDAMAEVAQLTGLTQLSLRGCGGLTGAPGTGFERLRALQSLRSLNLSQCTSLQVRHGAATCRLSELGFKVLYLMHVTCYRSAREQNTHEVMGSLSGNNRLCSVMFSIMPRVLR